MKDQLFASDDVPAAGSKPAKRKARPRIDNKPDIASTTKELLRESQTVLSQLKKALGQMAKVQQLAYEFLPKIDSYIIHCGQPCLPQDASNSYEHLDANDLRHRFSNLIEEVATAERKWSIFLDSFHIAPHQRYIESASPQTSMAGVIKRASHDQITETVSTNDATVTHLDKEMPLGTDVAVTRESVTAERSVVQTNLSFSEYAPLIADGPTNRVMTPRDTAQSPPMEAVSVGLKISDAEPVAKSPPEGIVASGIADLRSTSLAELNLPQPGRPVPPIEVAVLTDQSGAAALAARSSARFPMDTPLKTPLGLLTLLGIHGVGPQTVEKLISRYASLCELQETPPYMLKGVVTANIAVSLRDKEQWKQAAHDAQRIINDAEKYDARVVTIWDKEYPVCLKEISDKPLLLYVKGKLRPDCRAVACIGTREPSKFGYEVTRRISSTVVSHGWAIISGLALGVDSLAHEAALAGGGYTVAILGNGLDTVYPRKNAGLARDILDSGGALVSEQPFGAPPAGRNLVQRDRLQSGMSLGTIVMQTDIVGGSMHTVRYTLTQGRLLFAPVPSGAHRAEPKSQGLLALTENKGPAFAKIMNASGAYATLLQSKFADRSPAMPLVSRENYDDLLTQLEQAYQQNLGSLIR